MTLARICPHSQGKKGGLALHKIVCNDLRNISLMMLSHVLPCSCWLLGSRGFSLCASLPCNQTPSAETQTMLICSFSGTGGQINFFFLMSRPDHVSQLHAALQAASSSDLCRHTAGVLKWSRGFSFALQKAIGIEEAPLWPGKSQFGSGSLTLPVTLFERWGGREEGEGFPTCC